MRIEIPNVATFDIHHIVLDYNGTIASTGQLLKVTTQLKQLAEIYDIHLFTGDTFGNIESGFELDFVKVLITKTAEEKRLALEKIGAENCIAIGNGNMDYKMLEAAAIGIAVIGDEGCSTKAIRHADLVITNINHAFEMLLNPKKLIASLKE